MAHNYFAGHLYQLRSKHQLPPGAYVAVNGPWDTFGSILKSEVQANGEFLNLIRGVKPQTGVKPVAQF